MNRREFLQSIAAFATTVAIPFDILASAPESVIDQVWRAVSNDPIIFYVSEFGALSSDAVETYPATRKELLDYQEVASREELLFSAQENGSIADVLECEHSDPRWFDEDEPVPDNWEAWLVTADDGTVSLLIDRVNAWINGTPDEHDYEVANHCGFSGRGDALRYFRDVFEYSDALDIVVVEGDCPGSSYFAAELRMDIDEANELAKELDIPIRFAWQG
jgi:hypothetical protein